MPFWEPILINMYQNEICEHFSQAIQYVSMSYVQITLSFISDHLVVFLSFLFIPLQILRYYKMISRDRKG